MKDHGYTYIARWGRELGSAPYYIQDQCDKALRDKAPLNATFEDHGNPGTWHTTDDIVPTDTRLRLGLEPLPPTAPAVLRSYHGTLSETGTHHATTGEHTPEVRFPTLLHAARWVQDRGLTDRALLIGYSVQAFSKPALVRLNPEREATS